MGLTKTVHPPAGATALICAIDPVLVQLGWFMLPLVLLGTVLMLAVACVVNNFQRRWPIYWWTSESLAPSVNEVQDVEKTEINKRVKNEEDGIVVSRDSIKVPRWLVLEKAERALLDSLRLRLLEVRERSESEKTCINSSDIE
jgi:CBS-domain-containing membrane protein